MGASYVEFSIAGRSFKCSNEADGTRSLGGYENEFQANGDGVTGRINQKMMGWKFSIEFAIDNDNDDQEFLQGISDAGKFVPMKGVEGDGTVYSGKGCVTGAIEVSTMNGTATITVEGPGKFQKQ